MSVLWLALFAVSTATLSDPAIVRTGCDPDENQVATLPAGQSVEIRSALNGGSGTCYKIVTNVGGKEISGYLPAKALRGTDSFDQARRSAQGLGASQAAASEVKALAAKAATKTGNREHPAARALALIEANQPAEALSMLERDLKRYPQDPYLLAVAGYAYYKTDDVARAIIHWKESIDIEPNATVEQLLRRAEREKAADKGSERMMGNRVVLRYERGSIAQPLARAMLSVLDEEYTRVSFQLGCRANEKLMAIVQSRDTYFQSTAAAEWSGGQYDGRIHIPVSESAAIGPQMRRVFAHELVHACLSELGRWPAWVQEGLAQKYSGDTLPPGQREIVMQMIQAKQLPKLSDLGASFSKLSSEHARVAYSYACVAAEKLLELNASTGIGNLLRNPGDLGRYTAQVEKALGF